MDLTVGGFELGVIRDARRRRRERRALVVGVVALVLALAAFGAGKLTSGGGGVGAGAGGRSQAQSAATRSRCPARASGQLIGPPGGYVLIPNAPVGRSHHQLPAAQQLPAALRSVCGPGHMK